MSEPVLSDQVATQNSTLNFEEGSLDKSQENVRNLVESHVNTQAQETVFACAQSEKEQDSTFDSRDPFKNSLESKMAATTPEKMSEPVPSDQAAVQNSTFNFEEGSLDKSQKTDKGSVERNASTVAEETVSECTQSEKVQDSTFESNQGHSEKSQDPFKNSLESKMAAISPEKMSEPLPSDQVTTQNSKFNFEEGSLDKSQENVRSLVESNVNTQAQEIVFECAQSQKGQDSTFDSNQGKSENSSRDPFKNSLESKMA